jgi:hypothetical protein
LSEAGAESTITNSATNQKAADRRHVATTVEGIKEPSVIFTAPARLLAPTLWPKKSFVL